MDYGYVRVSSIDQHEDRQVAALTAAGVPLKNLVIEKQSGKDFQRPLWRKLVARLKPGDVLWVKSLDRLGRNYDEILWQWRFLTDKKKCAIVVMTCRCSILDHRKISPAS